MKTIITSLFLIFALCAAQVAQAAAHGFALSGKSYVQRAILEYDGVEAPLTVYVKSGAEGTDVVLDSSAGRILSVCLDESGNELSFKNSSVFPERLARKYALRDIRAVLGFLFAFGNEPVMISRNNLGMVAEISCGDWRAQFCDYQRRRSDSALLPRVVKINAEHYKISLFIADNWK